MSDSIEHNAKWHSLPADAVLSKMQSRCEGLSDEEAGARLARYGANEIKRQKSTPSWRLFTAQFKNIFIVMLLGASIFSFAIGESLDAAIILAIVIASAGLGFIQERRSAKALEILKQFAAPAAMVIRGGKEKPVPSKDIALGDIVVLRAGNRIPADLRLLEVANLKVDEASLTGESLAVDKTVEAIQEEAVLSDQTNIAFSGTTATYGRGMGVVVATGMGTEFGKIAGTVQAEVKAITPLERRMNSIGKWLTLFALVVCTIVVILGILRGYPLLEMVVWGVSLAVAAVPEALPAVVTGALAIGMYAMVKQKAIVKRLPAVETLGSTSIICSDKTGTMTKGEMTVKKIYVDGKVFEVSGVGYAPAGLFTTGGVELKPDQSDTLKKILEASVLNNDSKLLQEGSKWVVTGDTTEGALLVAAAKAGITEETLNHERINEIPFTSERKRMTTVHTLNALESKIAVIKGAPETVIERCRFILKDGAAVELTAEDRSSISRENTSMGSEALRIIALAYKYVEEIPEVMDEKKFENDFVFLGLMGMTDPPRPEVKDSLRLCKEAGIKVVMITGDQKLTAVAVAKELGILESQEDKVLTGSELEKMSDDEYLKVVEVVKVYARVSPEHKMKIVNALKSKGYVVAMTGDGVNDATALRMADIGIAMGITGTDVTKDTADMLLADDNFATIVNAVSEGRRIFDNIKKYLAYLLQCNLAEIGTILVGTLMALPLPLTAIQLLWINLTTDGLPALALGVDPAEPDVMKRKPRSLKGSIMNRSEAALYFVIVPAVLTIILLSNFTWALGFESEIEARTQVVTVMVVCELLIALSCHSLKHPIVSARPFSNKLLWLSVIVSFLMQLLILYVPFMHVPFDITYPTMQDWGIAAFSGAVIFSLVEASKIVIRKWP